MDDPLAQRPKTPPPGGLFAPGYAQPQHETAPAARPGKPPPPPPVASRVPTPMQMRILIALARVGGRGAIWQAADVLGVPDHCISQRFSEMVEKGLISKTFETNIRPVSEKRCAIYELTADGRGLAGGGA